MKRLSKRTVMMSAGVAAFVLGAPLGGWLLARQKITSGVANVSKPSLPSRVAVKGAKTSPAKPATTTPPVNPAPTAPNAAAGSTSPVPNGTRTLLWEEDFARYATATPSSARWNIANASTPVYNDEAQVYQPGSSTVRVAGGVLSLQAHRQGGGIISGMINTRNKLSVGVGTRLEARIKLPSGKGTWPAFWLLSQNQPHTSALKPTDANWAEERFYMWDGEIDIMEAYGTYKGIYEATLHTYDDSFEKDVKLPDPTGWHTYWMEWRSQTMTLGVDGTTLVTYQKNGKGVGGWPFTDNNKYYVILNLAMGGSGGGPIVDAAGDRWQMDVSRVAAYKL